MVNGCIRADCNGLSSLNFKNSLDWSLPSEIFGGREIYAVGQGILWRAFFHLRRILNCAGTYPDEVIRYLFFFSSLYVRFIG